jgi:hypothetical protein
MHWDNSFAGEGNRAQAAAIGMRRDKSGPRPIVFAKSRLATAKIKRRINRDEALRYQGLWGSQ